jgi:hypothetical protein
MSTDSIDLKAVKQEIVNWLRNSDIFTVGARGVTTAADTGTFAADSTHLIAVTNIKNIRSVVVGGSTLQYGEDYQVDFDFLDTTIKTKFTFTSPQTGAFTITYDYGTDKIFPDFPRPDLSISSFPRIGFDILNIDTDYGGLGNVLISSATAQIIIYALNTEDTDEYISSIRAQIIDMLSATIANTKGHFYYFPKYVKPSFIGPTIKSPREVGKDKVFQKNIDMMGEWKYEIN